MKNTGVVSAIIYLGISLSVAGLFFVSTLARSYTIIERVGGSLWIFLLLTIILMPVVIPWVKRKFTR